MFIFTNMVSIIMPVHNASLWIEETIDSILQQSYQDWELICIDDLSTDESSKKILAYKDDRIHFIKNKQKGIIPALQLGLSHSNGRYITRMDADDLMPENRLESMVEKIEASAPKTIITGRVEYFSDKEVSDGYRKYENWLNDRIRNNDHWKHIYRECVIASPNWLVRKKDLLESTIFDALEYPEDYDMTFRWMTNDFNIVPLDEITLFWREHPARTSRNSAVYDQYSFFQLKLQWFLKQIQPKHGIAIFGAGKKGKMVADFLDNQKIEFSIYDLKHHKYGAEINDPSSAKEPIALVCVYPDNLEQVNRFLEIKGYVIGGNAWFV